MDFLTRIPPNWFLWSLLDRRSSITHAGDTHERLYWMVQLQHVMGGRLVSATGDTPEEAFEEALDKIAKQYPILHYPNRT